MNPPSSLGLERGLTGFQPGLAKPLLPLLRLVAQHFFQECVPCRHFCFSAPVHPRWLPPWCDHQSRAGLASSHLFPPPWPWLLRQFGTNAVASDHMQKNWIKKTTGYYYLFSFSGSCLVVQMSDLNFSFPKGSSQLWCLIPSGSFLTATQNPKFTDTSSHPPCIQALSLGSVLK